MPLIPLPKFPRVNLRSSRTCPLRARIHRARSSPFQSRDNPSTAWIEKSSGDGIGQFIQFSSDKTFRVDKIDIKN